MDKGFLATVIKVTVVAVVLFIINTLIYLIPSLGAAAAGFVYPVYTTHIFFYGLCLIILFSLQLISKKIPDNTGYVFLILTSIQVAAGYVYINPVLSKTFDAKIEKVNIFVIFMLYLTLEAYFTTILLNKKQ